jgi:polyhydroxyalkanoate synthesis regulator phasin
MTPEELSDYLKKKADNDAKQFFEKLKDEDPAIANIKALVKVIEGVMQTTQWHNETLKALNNKIDILEQRIKDLENGTKKFISQN